METRNLFGILVLFLSVLSLTSCNKDEEFFLVKQYNRCCST